MKIFYKNLELGNMQFVDGNIIYTSNTKNEKEFKEKYILSCEYKLFDSNKKVLNKLPKFLMPYYDMTKNKEFIKLANINDSDTGFEKLEKLALLHFDDMGFYIKK